MYYCLDDVDDALQPSAMYCLLRWVKTHG